MSGGVVGNVAVHTKIINTVKCNATLISVMNGVTVNNGFTSITKHVKMNLINEKEEKRLYVVPDIDPTFRIGPHE